MERCPDRFGVVREHPTETTSDDPLRKHYLPGIVTGRVEQWDDLMVSVLSTRTLTIPNFDGTLLQIHVRPFDATYFVLAHCSCDGEANHPCQWDELSRISFRIFSQPI